MILDLSQVRWQTARASSSGTGGCVALANDLPPGVAAMRDSTRPEAGAHVTSRHALAALIHDARSGRYDI
jgi:Domain of unknown function (DUF397)